MTDEHTGIFETCPVCFDGAACQGAVSPRTAFEADPIAALDWDAVVAATDGHRIERVTVVLDDHGKAWTYITCTCGNEPGLEAFEYRDEYTDHIRRIVFNAGRPA